jgi:hypothetical protein
MAVHKKWDRALASAKYCHCIGKAITACFTTVIATAVASAAHLKCDLANNDDKVEFTSADDVGWEYAAH